MPLYKLDLREDRTYTTTVTIEAEDEEHANEIVWDEVGDLDWEYYDTFDSDVLDCRRVKGQQKIVGVKPVSSDTQDKVNALFAKTRSKKTEDMQNKLNDLLASKKQGGSNE